VGEALAEVELNAEDEDQSLIAETEVKVGIAGGALDRVMNQPEEKRLEYVDRIQPQFQLRLK
jgi:hypothetical protein